MNDRSVEKNATSPTRVPGPGEPGMGAEDEIQPDVMRRDRDAAGRDTVATTSAASFPASDPPSWSGGASVPVDREPPPTGEQAAWSVDRDAVRDAGSDATTAGSLEQTDEPDTELPVPTDDALQA